MRKLIALTILVSTAAYAQHFTHQWMLTGCSYAGTTRICTYRCVFGGETIAVQE